MTGGSGGDEKGNRSRKYGKTATIKTKKKLSNIAKKRTGNKNSFYGKIHNDKTRRFLSESQKGEKSAVYDITKYIYVNHVTNEEFIGTQYEFVRHTNIDSGNTTKLVNGVIKSIHKWTLKGNDVPIKGKKPCSKVYTIEKNNIIFKGTRKEIMKKIKSTNISRFIDRTFKTCKGWRLM